MTVKDNLAGAFCFSFVSLLSWRPGTKLFLWTTFL